VTTSHLPGGKPGPVAKARTAAKPFCDGSHLTVDFDGTLVN